MVERTEKTGYNIILQQKRGRNFKTILKKLTKRDGFFIITVPFGEEDML